MRKPLQNFKVPSTADRDELNRIAYTDEYLPSDYQLDKLHLFHLYLLTNKRTMLIFY